MYLNTMALVLRVSEYNDRDALLTLLTRDHGKLTVKARGLRRKNSPMSAPCQLLAFSEFVLFEYRGMYTVNEARSVELFTSLRKDLDKLSLGTYFAQVAEVISQADVPNRELQSLVLNCLYALAETKLPVAQIKAVFEIRAACIAGYTPDLFGCYCHLGTQLEYIDLSGGVLLCERCKDKNIGIRYPISVGILEAMRYIVSCDAKKLFGFVLGVENLRQLSAVAEAYLITQLERGFSALDFYKSLLI
jgi:DNA repair protein RecO (recombination protein O)